MEAGGFAPWGLSGGMGGEPAWRAERWGVVLVLWTMSIPALVCLLLAVTTLELLARWTGRLGWLPWRRKQRDRGLPASAATFDIFGSVFTDRRAEFEQRQAQSMFRDDEAQGGPPRGRIDLDSGLVRLSPPTKPPEQDQL